MDRVAWLDERLAQAGARRTGPVVQTRARPWGTVLRAPTTSGVVWLKAGGDATRYEAALYEVLAQIAPERALAPETERLLALGVPDMHPAAAARLRDAYLEPWGDLASRGELIDTVELARRAGRIARAHTWLRAIGDGSDPTWADAPRRTLAELLDDAPLSRPSRG